MDDPQGCIHADLIMNLAEAFARDGIGASSLGFEISVRWTSLDRAVQSDNLVGPDRQIA
jgi:hypothetical protein